MRKLLSVEAGAKIADLLNQTVAEHPPLGYHFRAPERPGAHPLGNYLLSLGYITPRQLIDALMRQRRSIQLGRRPPLGNILVQAQVIHPRVLTTVLLLQMVDRVLDPGYSPTLLGERLVIDGVLDPLELAPALQLQIWHGQSGTVAQIGDLLVRQGSLTPAQLAGALSAQQQGRLQSLAAPDIFDASPLAPDH